MSNDDTTQDGPVPPPAGRFDLYAVLVHALEEAQWASGQLLDAARRHPEDVVIAAHDACAWWWIAERTLRRAEVRIRIAPTCAGKDHFQQAMLALSVTHKRLNERLVAAFLTPPAANLSARRELEQLQHDFAIALPREGART